MKSIALRLLALAFVPALAGQLFAQTNDAPLSPTNRIELFNGKDLSGWTFFSKDTNAVAAAIWSVTNGVIVCQGKPYGYARTVQTWRDYRLHVEWRWPDGPGNSGVFLHINPPEKVWPNCFEAQLAAGNAGEIRCNGGSHVNELTAAFPKSVPRRQPSSEKPASEWNAYDIVCRSNTMVVRVNGVLQNQVSGTSVSSGAIGLQAEGKLAEFRNFFIEPLPAQTE